MRACLKEAAHTTLESTQYRGYTLVTGHMPWLLVSRTIRSALCRLGCIVVYSLAPYTRGIILQKGARASSDSFHGIDYVRIARDLNNTYRQILSF